MAKIPFINKKYLFLQNLLYVSVDVANSKNQKFHLASTRPFSKLNEKTQLKSLNNSNVGSTDLSSSKTMVPSNVTIKSHKNVTSVSNRPVDFFKFPKNKTSKVSLQNIEILKSMRSKPLLNSIGGSLPYKKSLFCYWLLPFIGFISSISIMTDSKTLESNSLNKNFVSNKFFERNLTNSNGLTNPTQIYYLKNNIFSTPHFNAFSEEFDSNLDMLNIKSFSDLIEKFHNSSKTVLENKILHSFNNSAELDNYVPFYSYLNWEILKNFKQNQSNFSATWLNSSLNTTLLEQTIVQLPIQNHNATFVKKPSELMNIENNKKDSNHSIKNDLTLSFAQRLENDSYSLLNDLIFPNVQYSHIKNNPAILEKNRTHGVNKTSTNASWKKNPIFFFPKHKISFSVLKQNVKKNAWVQSNNEISNFLVAVSNKNVKTNTFRSLKLKTNYQNPLIHTNKMTEYSNLSFLLEMDEHNYLPNFLTTQKSSLNNPLSSYKTASLLLDELIEPTFTKKLDTWITKNSLKKMSNFKHSIENLQTHEKNQSHIKTVKNIELKDIYSSMSMLANTEVNTKLGKFETSSFNELEFKDKDLNQDIKSFSIEKTNLLLEKSIVFLLKKQVFQKNIQVKDSIKLNETNQTFTISSNSDIKKLNKDSLYLLIFNSLKTSLNNTVHDQMLQKHETLNKSDAFVLTSPFDLKKFETKLSTHDAFLKNAHLNDPIIKLVHPIWVSNVEKKTPKVSRSFDVDIQKKSNPLNAVDNFNIDKIMKETKTQSQNLNSIYQKGQTSSKNEMPKFSKLNSFIEQNKNKTVITTNFPDRNYTHLSKYLHFLSKKVQQIWLNPINSDLSKNFKVSENKMSFLKNKDSLKPIKQYSPTFFRKNINSQQTVKDLNFITSLNQNFSSNMNLNGLKIGSFKKSYRLNPSTVTKPMNYHVKKNRDQTPNQFKSQLFRLEKIFRSYLSKKNSLDKNQLNYSQKKLLKGNQNLNKQSSNILKSSFHKTFMKLPKTSDLRFKTFKKLTLTDSNYVLSEHNSIKTKVNNLFFIKHPVKNLKLNNKSFDLSPTLYLKNRSFVLKSRIKKFSRTDINKKSVDMLKKMMVNNRSFKNFFSEQANTDDLINLNLAQNPGINLNAIKLKPMQEALNYSSEYNSLFEKRDREKKKRRKKKQRKETRRRKKRKRFFPRPSWLRFKLYAKFLKSRHLKNFQIKNGSIPSLNLKANMASHTFFKGQTAPKFKQIVLGNQTNTLAFNHLEKVLWREKIYRNYKQMWTNPGFQEVSISQVQGTNHESPYLVDSNYFPYFVNKDFYQVSRTVLGDLKRVFWKSYWLRSNLNPYLNRVKTYLTDMKNSTKNWSMYLNLRNLSNTLLGINMLNTPFPQNFVQTNSKMNLPGLNNSNLMNQLNSGKMNVEHTSLKFSDSHYFNVKNYLQNCQSMNTSSNKWQIAVNVTEYQRIMYERIQQTILNIRENLNLNGQIRARSSRIGRKKLLTPKPVKDFWIKFGKAITFEIPNNQAVDFYGDMSKVRRWWAFNKSNLASFKPSNKRKDLWISQKLREQSKSNKTKKIMYQMIKNLNNGLDEKTTLLNSSNFSNLLMKSLTIKPFFNRFLIDKAEPIVLPTLNLSDKIQDLDVKSKNILIFDKLKRSLEMSEQKLRKKENKLSYLGFFNKKISSSSLDKHYFRSLKKQFQRLPLSNSLEINDKIQTNVSYNKFTSDVNYWWKGESLSLKMIPSFKNAPTLLDTNLSLLLASTFLFHFCAFISLLSSTEVRGLLKFYTILGSKIFKIYLDLIFSISQFVLKPLNPMLKLNLGNSHLFDKQLNSFQTNEKQTSILQQFLFAFSLPFMSKQRHKTLKETYLNQAISKGFIWSSFLKRQQYENMVSDLSPANSNNETAETILNRNSKIQVNNFSLTTLTHKTLRRFKNPILLKKDKLAPQFLNNWAWTLYFGINPNKSNLSILKNMHSTKTQNKRFQLAYFSLLNMVTKPILWMDALNTISNKKLTLDSSTLELNSNLNKKELVLSQNQLISMKLLNFNKLLILSSLNFVISSSYKGSFYLRTWLIKSLDIFQAILGSIYLFFEKPGELIVDWIAYAFLVEWSSDLTTTIPDALDISTMTSYSKLSRGMRPFILGQSLFMFSPIGLTNGLIQRQMWQFYQSVVAQLCQPDTDLLIRQKKGMVFWDIWSELLIDVAEDANINISELTSLKEEQNRLLDKLEQSASSSFAMFKNKQFKQGFSTNSSLESIEPNSFFMKSMNLLNSKKHLEKKQKMIKNSNFLNTKILKGHRLTIPTQTNQKQLTWSVNQFLSYQGKDTELFIDLHPPKSFSHLPSIKYSQSIQQPVGTIICQIFSGIFHQQIAKNILVVGSPGNEKTVLIQAIAGETELKIITDNAQRYAMVYRGVAVGIKLLRDVFEALSLHTPCIFLLEDIHHIGERRPFLISDDENSKATEFGSEKEEIHEKNQVIYQLSKHFVSHYKKPYKGDFSLLIPTNHFCFNLFLGVSSPRTRSYQVTPSNPLQFDKLNTDQNQSSYASNKKQTKNLKDTLLSSSLQIKSDQLLAPPATSPFSVLILKEEKKLKPKQLVKEMPWSGLPGEQLALISKANYSIRVKIALLADMALSNVSVKLDMITDLLVIIDSVKGNRGFIVFATTHLPYILDPALRRPGRFDETVALPLIPNLFSRWEILKTNFAYFTQPSVYSSFQMGSTVDFTNISGFFNSNFESSKLSEKLVSFNKKIRPNKLGNKAGLLASKKAKIHSKNLTLSYDLTTKEEPFINPTQIQYAFTTHQNKVKINQISKSVAQTHDLNQNSKKTYLKLNSLHSIHELKEINQKGYKKPLPKAFFNLIAKTYFSISRILTHLISHDLNNATQHSKRIEKTFIIPPIDLISFDSNIYLSLYASNQTLKEHLMHLMAGKLGELFAFSNYNYAQTSKLSQHDHNISTSPIKMNYGLMSMYGIDKTWRAASSLLFSVITKRYLHNKNLTTPKLLYFSNFSSLNEAPTPPSSNILLPLKRYENYGRTFNSEQSKHKAKVQGNFLQTTLELHQQQRLVKRLYKLPIREFFKSEIISEKLTGFGNSSITLSSVEKNLMKLTNSQSFYRHRILNRHRNYLNTQWWNAQLSEHNAESTFLSDIDWRYTFVESIGDIFIDFPDSDQFYNPRNRRWMLTSGSWNNWFNFEKTTLYDIYQQYTFDCFTKVYNSLDQHREILDFYAFTSLNQCTLHHLKEITMINIFKRFS